MLKIKICGITDTANLLDIAAGRPDGLGFIFAPSSPRRTDPPILDVPLPANIRRIGVFVNPSIDEVRSFMGRLDFIQLHGDEPPELADHVRALGFGVIKAFAVHDAIPQSRIARYTGSVDYVLLDTAGPAAGGNGRRFDWRLLDEYTAPIPFFLSGGISIDDAPSLRSLRHPNFAGVDINSRFETSPGIKNAARVREFIDTIRREL